MKKIGFLFIILCLVISCSDDSPEIAQLVPNDQQTAPVEADFELVNARKIDDRVFLDSFRYRQVSSFDDGIASVTIPNRTSVSLDENDIKVFVRVDESDISRVKDLSLSGSEQPWSEMRFVSQITDDIVKICVQIQPSSQTINSAGLTEVTLRARRVFTVIDDSINCVGVSADGTNVFSGLESSYFVVDDNTKVEAITRGDMKAGRERVGTQVEFSFSITE